MENLGEPTSYLAVRKGECRSTRATARTWLGGTGALGPQHRHVRRDHLRHHHRARWPPFRRRSRGGAIYERGVVLKIDASEAARLPAPGANPGALSVNPADLVGGGPVFSARLGLDLRQALRRRRPFSAGLRRICADEVACIDARAVRRSGDGGRRLRRQRSTTRPSTGASRATSRRNPEATDEPETTKPKVTVPKGARRRSSTIKEIEEGTAPKPKRATKSRSSTSASATTAKKNSTPPGAGTNRSPSISVPAK